MEERNYTVYMHKCPNGKVYIGITKRNVKKRWEKGHGYYSNKHFYRAILKYGWDNIQHIILETNLTQKEACEKEIELIKKFDSNNPKHGYNHTKGGLGYNGFNHVNWNIILPSYDEVKKSDYLSELFDVLVKLAKGYSHIEKKVDIFEENGIEVNRQRTVTIHNVEPNINILDMIVRNYSNEIELENLIIELLEIKNQMQEEKEC